MARAADATRGYGGGVAAERFTPEPGRDLGPLIHALRRHGGTLTFTEWVEVPNSMVIALHLPEDDERAQLCRDAIEAWRTGS